jgi:hypothetical protein
MTPDQYREELGKLDVGELRSLHEQICKGGRITVDAMAVAFVNFPDVEEIAVHWFRKHNPGFQLKTQAELGQEANIRSADLAEEELAVSRKSLRVLYGALALALVSLLVSIIGLLS